MWRRLQTALAVAALCSGLAVMANASESRVVAFKIACDGTQKSQELLVSGLGTANTRFIQGAEASLFEASGKLQYLLVLAGADPKFTLLTMGLDNTHVARDFTGFFSVPNQFNGSIGNISIDVAGSCIGPGTVQGFLVINFFS